MYSIKFGTDGWRAIIAREYTVDNVRRIAAGTLAWLQSRKYTKVVMGYDCRFGGTLFMQEIATILAQDGILYYLKNLSVRLWYHLAYLPTKLTLVS
jgi:phosphomannomutase